MITAFVHSIASRNRNLATVAAPMPRVKKDNWPGIFRSIHESNVAKNAICLLGKYASGMRQKTESQHFTGIFPFSRQRHHRPVFLPEQGSIRAVIPD
jgi:hypothetical protein